MRHSVTVLLAALVLLFAPGPCPETPEEDTPEIQAVQAIPPPVEAGAALEETDSTYRVHIIKSCVITWYTEDTCGKEPDHPAYGITASGLPVEDGVTCAVDPEVIPLGSTVWIHYQDGTVDERVATDTGVSGEWVDVYTPDIDYAVQCGLQVATVYWRGEVDAHAR